MWLRPYSLHLAKTASHDSTSVGGYPVSGKQQFSTVPLSQMGMSLSMNCLPTMEISRMPKVTGMESPR